ncbi:MAG: hypothetical protein PVJ55_12665 [Anaerolineae bacterium]|jgi:hypothetical protein
MDQTSKLTKLLEWLNSTGRTKAWFARTVGYCYQTTWMQLAGMSPLTERFVVHCFSNIPDLPADVFQEHGYYKDGHRIIKVIPMQKAESEGAEEDTVSG